MKAWAVINGNGEISLYIGYTKSQCIRRFLLEHGYYISIDDEHDVEHSSEWLKEKIAHGSNLSCEQINITKE